MRDPSPHLQLQEGTIGGAKTSIVNCKTCGELSAFQQDVARCRQSRVIKAIFAPDTNTQLVTAKPIDRNKRPVIVVTRKDKAEREYQIGVPKSAATKVNMVNDDTEEGNQDLIMHGVPIYEDGTAEEQDMSVKDMLTAMRSEFRTIGKKVATFETKLGATQNNMLELSNKMEDVASNQEKYRCEAREAETRTNAELAGMKEAQVKLEAGQAIGLRQLQQQVLQEVNEKIQLAHQFENGHGTQKQGRSVTEDGDWVKKAKAACGANRGV